MPSQERFFEVGTGAVLSTLDLLLEKAFSPALFNGVFFSRPPFLPLTMAHRGTLELVLWIADSYDLWLMMAYDEIERLKSI